MSITINLEIGHDASLRTKTTPEGFTHDWEVYVKGCNGADIHHYVEKVVFYLHETFPKPKRVIKEPPYSLRTSGYAGFNLPIEIYLRNNQEPKKIKFNYDLQLQPRGPPIHNVQKEKYVFHSPSEEFRNKLLKGGGIIGSAGSNQDLSESKMIDEKNQMTSKPKLSGSDMSKKHKIKIDEPRNTDFLNLFGPPITKTSKAPEPPKPKEPPKAPSKIDKPIDKDKNKPKNSHKDKSKEKSKEKDKTSEGSDKKKEEKKKSKEDKSKDRERNKEKSSKKDKEKEKSPPRNFSPKRSPKRPLSPSPQRHSSSKEKEREQSKDKDRKDERKSKKVKREHKDSKHKDRDKDKEHKEHKSRDSKSSKEFSNTTVKDKEISPAPIPSAPAQLVQKVEKKEKSKEIVKQSKEDEKLEPPRSDKSEDKQRHKHKKKDRKEKREDKYSSKAEKKLEKPPQNITMPVKEETRDPPPVSSTKDTDKSNLFGSPKSEPPSTPNQSEPKEKSTSNSTFKDDDNSNDSMKVSSRESSPIRVASKSPSELPPEPIKKLEVEKKKEEPPKKKEKKEKKKDKKGDRDHEKRKKRKSPEGHTATEPPAEKLLKEEENNNSDDERKVSSTEDANPPVKTEEEDYMSMLRDLQHKIMGLKNNSDLQKVVQLIAETGRYEVSAHTFDFDLCVLDRSTVRQLQDFFTTIS